MSEIIDFSSHFTEVEPRNFNKLWHLALGHYLRTEKREDNQDHTFPLLNQRFPDLDDSLLRHFITTYPEKANVYDFGILIEIGKLATKLDENVNQPYLVVNESGLSSPKSTILTYGYSSGAEFDLHKTGGQGTGELNLFSKYPRSIIVDSDGEQWGIASYYKNWQHMRFPLTFSYILNRTLDYPNEGSLARPIDSFCGFYVGEEEIGIFREENPHLISAYNNIKDVFSTPDYSGEIAVVRYGGEEYEIPDYEALKIS